MDLVIGKHCSVVECNVRDLLPIECSCQKFFCRNHISLEKHRCPGKPGVSPEGQTTTWSKRASCGMADCNKLTLASAFDGSGSSLSNLNDGICLECKGAFCATHRHPSSHACISANNLPPVSKSADAKAILAKNFPTISKPTGTRAPITSGKLPTDPVKLARFRAVELMKMRHKAVPGDGRDKTTSVPIEERLHVTAVADRANPSRTQVLWFRKVSIILSWL
ncbi:hypothetical protein BS47DRAFT_1341006 [Hydnum rufescens UP504]|uniref:AN1-type domain-containing protein n=1 Tax=Hydnum rufescens UP504 TaxID=1448309 RepID=A0A9P6B2W1_9AGAM|nr:hypothetical protein BS47DRAFT_1341006 [Hydnum rufescens UP504]